MELGVVVVCFLFFGGGGPVSFRAVKGEGGRVSFGVGCETVAVVVCFFLGGGGGESACSVWLAQRLTRVRKCALSGRDSVRKGFCQAEILSGRNFVRKGFCPAPEPAPAPKPAPEAPEPTPAMSSTLRHPESLVHAGHRENAGQYRDVQIISALDHKQC